MNDRVRRFLPALALAGAWVLVGTSAQASGSATNGFRVQVTVADVAPNDQDDFCTLDTRAFDAIVTVACGTGAVVQVAPPSGWRGWKPVHGGAYRFLPPVLPSGVMSEESDLYTGLGTVTSWRLVSLKDRDYLEMTLRW